MLACLPGILTFGWVAMGIIGMILVASGVMMCMAGLASGQGATFMIGVCFWIIGGIAVVSAGIHILDALR